MLLPVRFQGVHLALQQLCLHPAVLRGFGGGLCCCRLLLQLPLHLLQGCLVLLGLKTLQHRNSPARQVCAVPVVRQRQFTVCKALQDCADSANCLMLGAACTCVRTCISRRPSRLHHITLTMPSTLASTFTNRLPYRASVCATAACTAACLDASAALRQCRSSRICDSFTTSCCCSCCCVAWQLDSWVASVAACCWCWMRVDATCVDRALKSAARLEGLLLLLLEVRWVLLLSALPAHTCGVKQQRQ